MVRYLNNMDEYKTVLETSKSKLVVIDFTATWYVGRTDATTKHYPVLL